MRVMHPIGASLAAALFLAVGVALAQDQRLETRLFVAPLIVAPVRQRIWVDGVRRSEPSRRAEGGLSLGLSRFPWTSHVGFLVLGRVTMNAGSDSWAQEKVHFDALVGPDFRLLWSNARPGSSVHILVPFGIAATWVDKAGPSFAVDKKYNVGWGMSLGMLVGYDMMIRGYRKGLSFDVGAMARTTWIKKTETLAISGEQSVQNQRWLEIALLASVGFAAWR